MTMPEPRARIASPMPKPELEFFRPDHIPWQPVTGSTTAGVGGPGVKEKILREEVWIIEGELIDLGKMQTLLERKEISSWPS